MILCKFLDFIVCVLKPDAVAVGYVKAGSVTEELSAVAARTAEVEELGAEVVVIGSSVFVVVVVFNVVVVVFETSSLWPSSCNTLYTSIPISKLNPRRKRAIRPRPERDRKELSTLGNLSFTF